MNNEIEQSLRNTFGYVPNEECGERWVVYQDNLIVIHFEKRPRIYKRGCNGAYYEIEPNLF